MMINATEKLVWFKRCDWCSKIHIISGQDVLISAIKCHACNKEGK